MAGVGAGTAAQVCNTYSAVHDVPWADPQVLKDHGVDQATLDAAVRAQLAEADATSAVEDGVAAVLLESAAAEVARLREAAEGAATAQASLQRLSEVRLSLSVLCRAQLRQFKRSPQSCVGQVCDYGARSAP